MIFCFSTIDLTNVINNFSIISSISLLINYIKQLLNNLFNGTNSPPDHYI
ncbi:Uncharacterized protein dnl_62220 [Desulfonema limicola]|uniref:Uncharacterized protein n=1 Tax=Desulfonema limicola TaxID=45656 RepID=A0A975BE64_9BACT|nr:Uncharacterized protein dnl_62220 [Desulfonema limicola]